METVYIYPHGIRGKVLGAMITCVRDVKLCFIDDRDEETSLEAYAETLRKNRAVVLVARSPFNQTADTLITKLQKEQILYRDNAVDEAALEVVAKINTILQAKKWQTTLAIEISGFADNKHIGTIDTELLQRNPNIHLLYLCGLPETFEKVQQHIAGKDNCLAFCLPCFYFHLLDNVQALAATSRYFTPKNHNVPTFYLGHALVDWSKVDQAKLQSYKETYDYICVGGADFFPQNHDDTYLPSGYLGFDRIAHKITANIARVAPPPRKIALFCPYNIDECQKMLAMALCALQDYDVRFRIRYRNLGEPPSRWNHQEMTQILMQLRTYPNFSIDENEQISEQTYLETFCCVCGATNMRYTYPLLALRPSIVIGENPLPPEFGIVLGNQVSNAEFLAVLNRIYDKQESFQCSLLQYREQKIFNFGTASAWIADDMIKKLGLG